MHTAPSITHEIKAAVIQYMEGGRSLWIMDAMGSTILRLGFFERARIGTSNLQFGMPGVHTVTNEIFVNGSVSYCIGAGYPSEYPQLSMHELGELDFIAQDKMISIRVEKVIFEEGSDTISVIREDAPVIKFILDGIVTSDQCETSPSSHIDLITYDDVDIILPFNNRN